MVTLALGIDYHKSKKYLWEINLLSWFLGHLFHVKNKKIGVHFFNIYVIIDFSDISARVWEFYSTFRLSFWNRFQERGWVVCVVLASLSRVRFGECLLSEFLQSKYLVGWEVQEILRITVDSRVTNLILSRTRFVSESFVTQIYFTHWNTCKYNQSVLVSRIRNMLICTRFRRPSVSFSVSLELSRIHIVHDDVPYIYMSSAIFFYLMKTTQKIWFKTANLYLYK